MEERCKVNPIQILNDVLRCTYIGGDIFITRGIQALGEETVRKIMNAVSRFNAFDDDNDPHGGHDCASLTVEGIKVLWKIDYYDLSGEFGSEDPADPAKTKRVLTVMLASEY